MNGYVLSVEDQLKLLRPYTAKDVKEAMFGIDKNKSSGPDGYGSGFFQDTWSVVGEEAVGAVLEFFENGKLLKQINSTSITLIPKVEMP